MSSAARGPGRASWSESVALGLYATALLALLPWAFLRLAWRGWREPGYRWGWSERLGFGKVPEPAWRGCVWIHAVSLGETRAARPLIDALLTERADVRLLLTHGTATGRAAGAEIAATYPTRVTQRWLPFDLPWAQRRWLRAWQPALGVVMETEVWPQLLAQAERLRVPLVLVNARMSERSARGYRRLAPLSRPAFARFSRVLAQSADDAKRLRELGADPVMQAGSLKFDMQPDLAQRDAGRNLRARLGRPVLLAAATREGEEDALLDAWQALLPPIEGPALSPPPLLLLVPRHPQRFDTVARLIETRGLALERRAAFDDDPTKLRAAQVLLGDSLGEMALYYGLADLAIMGGSLLPFGSQNFIEACACGCPVLLGPSRFNFQAAAEAALAAGAVRSCRDAADAVTQALALLGYGPPAASADAPNDRPALQDQSRAAERFVAQHRGATRRHLSVLLELLDASRRDAG